jgi:hypothetical protein
MRLLVSLRDVSEVEAARAGRADILDVKDPARGALGAPAPETIRAVRSAAPPPELVSVALGESVGPLGPLGALGALGSLGALGAPCPLREWPAVAREIAGVDFVKLALVGEVRRAGIRLRELVDAVGEAHPGTRVVAVAYADARASDEPSVYAIPDVAAAAGAYGVMLDTATKDARTLLDHLQERELARWIQEARAAGLLVGLAGSLGAREIERIRDLRPDVVGVRGAACRGGRSGTLDAQLISALRNALRGRPGLVAGAR